MALLQLCTGVCWPMTSSNKKVTAQQKERAREVRRADRKKELRLQIINGATGLFGRYGYFKTTVDEIADAAGMSKATLYKVIRCKEEALTLVIRHEADLMFDRIRAILAGHKDPVQKLKVLAIELARDASQQLVLSDVTTQTFEELEPHLQRELRRMVQEIALLIREILEQGVQEGKFRKLDIENTSFAAALGIKEIVMHWNVELVNLDIEQIIEPLMDILLHGLLQRDN